MHTHAGALSAHALQRGMLRCAVPVGQHARLKFLLSPVSKFIRLKPAQCSIMITHGQQQVMQVLAWAVLNEAE
jgi:hypothetical protein